jgi:uncharacterized damage-inducible protein DinB
MSTIRRWHFDQMRHGLEIVSFLVQSNPADALITYRDGGQGWTVAEVIGHLLDCERLFVARAKLTMTQDNPALPFPPQDDDVAKGRYNERAPQAILDDWRQVRGEYIAYLETVPDEAWSREGTHPVYPPFSLNDQLFLACRHDLDHIEQMTRILIQKQR